MPRTSKKTDNDHFDEKVGIRVLAINAATNKTVLDCFHGNGMLWNRVSQLVPCEIGVVGIEKIRGKGDAIFRGEAIKFLPKLDLSKYGVIDLDAYEVPFDETKAVLDSGWKGSLLITLIQSQHGRLPNALNGFHGIQQEMIDQIPSIFNLSCWEKFSGFLYEYGIRNCLMHEFGNKRYFLISV